MIQLANENQGKVSIILPVYNGEKFLSEAIKSCINQTYKNIEIIIINDCSTDDSLQIAQDFKLFDDRISIFSNAKNLKLPASLNRGHYLAKGEFITWISHDNFFNINAIEKLVTSLINTSLDVVYSDFTIIEKNGKIRSEFKLEKVSPLIFGNSIGASFLYKKEVFERNVAYDENLHTVEDYDFWLRASLHSDFTHLAESLYNFRSHNSSLSHKRSIENSQENKLFNENLKQCYRNFLDHLGIHENENYSEILMRLHQHKKIDVLSFLKDYSSYEKLIKKIKVQANFLNIEKVEDDLDIRLRANIRYYEENQNKSVLMIILRKRPSILLKHDAKNSLRIIKKCLFG
jgi:glycosyltransferase involved in cell wall biosynthesis